MNYFVCFFPFVVFNNVNIFKKNRKKKRKEKKGGCLNKKSYYGLIVGRMDDFVYAVCCHNITNPLTIHQISIMWYLIKYISVFSNT